MFWGFVDYENMGSLEEIDFSLYERVFVFLGPKNNKLKLGEISFTGFCSLELLSLKSMGRNNLDFHLVFHLGRFHEIADETIEFHVITNDMGFNGLIAHLKSIGRKCKRISSKKMNEQLKILGQLSNCAKLVVNRLTEMDGRKRPRSKVKLVNWIKSQCVQLLNGADPHTFYNELKKAKVIIESGSDITYEIKC